MPAPTQASPRCSRTPCQTIRGAPDLGERGDHEQNDRAEHGHGRAPYLSRVSSRSPYIGLDLHVDSKAYGRRMPTTFQIAEVAQRSGFTAATLRYYEDIGLVAPASRTEAGYRLYDETSLERLRFIARAKQLGCSLEEIAELTTVWDGGRCANVQRRLRETVEAKITDARGQIADLSTLAADLQRAASTLSAQPVEGPCDDSCGCTTDTSASTGTTVPIVAKADATTGSADSPAGEVPIACTLGAGEMPTRIDAWNAVLQRVTARQSARRRPASRVPTRHRRHRDRPARRRRTGLLPLPRLRLGPRRPRRRPRGSRPTRWPARAHRPVRCRRLTAWTPPIPKQASASSVSALPPVSPAAPAPSSGSSPPPGIASVLGAVIFGVVGLVVVLAVAAVLYRRRRRRAQYSAPTTGAVPLDLPQLNTRE